MTCSPIFSLSPNVKEPKDLVLFPKIDIETIGQIVELIGVEKGALNELQDLSIEPNQRAAMVPTGAKARIGFNNGQLSGRQ